MAPDEQLFSASGHFDIFDSLRFWSEVTATENIDSVFRYLLQIIFLWFEKLLYGWIKLHLTAQVECPHQER